jgi:hypothetical protein
VLGLVWLKVFKDVFGIDALKSLLWEGEAARHPVGQSKML